VASPASISILREEKLTPMNNVAIVTSIEGVGVVIIFAKHALRPCLMHMYPFQSIFFEWIGIELSLILFQSTSIHID
jgi:hypothetical protein